MTVIDIGIVAILVFFVVWGCWFGLVRQVSWMLALVAAFVVAGTYVGETQQLLAPLSLSPRFIFLLSYLLLVVIVYLVIRLLAIALRRVVTLALNPWFDRALGGVFGVAKAYLLLVLVYLALTALAPAVATMSAWQNSYFHPYLESGARLLKSWIQDEGKVEIFRPVEPAITVVMPVPGTPPELVLRLQNTPDRIN